MKKGIRSTLLLSLITLSLSVFEMSSLQAAGPAEGKINQNTVVAKVKDQEIRLSEVIQLLQAMPELQQMGPEAIEPIISLLISKQLLMEEAKKSNISASDPELKKILEMAEKEARVQIYIKRLMDRVVTEDKMKKKFDELMKNFQKEDEVDLQHILVGTEAEAKNIIKELDKGTKFEAIAAQKSLDTASKTRGGSIGPVTKGMLTPEIGSVAFNLREGKYGKTPVKSQHGWHVLKVNKRGPRQKPTFEKVKDQVRMLAEQEALNDLFRDLQEKNKDVIILFDESGKGQSLAQLMAKSKEAQASAPAASSAAPAK